MIQENLQKGLLISGLNKKYYFDSKLYLQVCKFVMKKFNIKLSNAKGILNYFIVSKKTWHKKKIINIYKGNKKETNARLKNIINLDYEWKEFFN